MILRKAETLFRPLFEIYETMKDCSWLSVKDIKMLDRSQKDENN